MKKMKKLHNKHLFPENEIVLHPFLFSIFPIISLYYTNIDLAHIYSTFLPISISLGTTTAFYFFLKKIFTNKNKAGLLTSLLVLLFFTFGYCLNFKIAATIGDIKILFFQIYLVLWTTILIILPLVIIRTKMQLILLTQYFNIISIATIFYVIFLIVGYFLINHPTNNYLDNAEPKTFNTSFPDVYYIILDAYAREDVLDKYYNLDNSVFIDFLEKKGFYVAKKSNANYPETYYSLASSLNAKYVNYLKQFAQDKSADQSHLKHLIRNNLVQKKFKKNGYTLVNIPSIWTSTNQIKGDITMKNKRYLTEFDIALIDTTPLALLFTNKLVLDSQRNRILEIFEHISKVPEIEGPTFSYIHILAPHPPFLFDKTGNPINKNIFAPFNDGCSYLELNPDRNDYIKKYTQQLSFINNKVERAVSDILEKSDHQPVIIIQGDHGPRSTCDPNKPISENVYELFPILNAYYLPDKGKDMLYESISPVNTFRIVFETLFDERLKPLEDRSFYVNGEENPYDFVEVSEKLHNN